MQNLVTTVTTLAESADELKPSDYRDIYQEVRKHDPTTGDYAISLRAYCGLIAAMLPGQETLSIGYWSKYHNDQISLTRRARNELRAIVGLPQLPPTIAEAIAPVDPDATVYQVGQATPDRLILVGSDIQEPITLRINGRLETLDDPTPDPVETTAVTTVTGTQRHAPRSSIVLTRPTWERLNAARQNAGQTWEQFVAPLLAQEEIQ